MRLASYLDSEQSKKAATVVVKNGRKFGCVLYVMGLVYLVMLPNENFNRKNFFDENALMAGLVKREFEDTMSIAEYVSRLKNAASDEVSYMSALEQELATLGLEVYSQNFSATGFVSVDTKDAVVGGRNVYGILRAGRAQSTEAIILSAPYLTGDEGNIHGAAIMLSLAKYFRGKNYWAKDLIFLTTSHGGIGVQAWIDQYLGLDTSAAGGKFGISSTSLLGRSGAIQAVINIEIPSSHIQYANIVIEGVNGLLPNLDLVNVMVYLCYSEKVKTAFHDRWEWLGPSQLLDGDHQLGLYTAVAMASYQAVGLPQGGHAHFLQHRIDSLTVRGVGKSHKTGTSKSLLGVARALEGTFRSVNNLLETLHHSEFFYFTAASWRFISIGLYMPALALLLAPLVLEALSQWVQSRNSQLQLNVPPQPSPSPGAVPSFPFHVVLRLVLSCYGSGLLLYSSVLLGAHLFSPLDTQGLVTAIAAPLALSVLVPLIVRSEIPADMWRMAKSISLILSLLTLLALGMMNFSLAILVSLGLTVPAVLAQPHLQHQGSQLFSLPRLLLCLILSPPAVLTLFSTLYLYFLLPASTPFPSLLVEGAEVVLKGTASAFNAWLFHSCWLFPLACVGVWPLWLMAWVLSTQRDRDTRKLHSD